MTEKEIGDLADFYHREVKECKDDGYQRGIGHLRWRLGSLPAYKIKEAILRYLEEAAHQAPKFRLGAAKFFSGTIDCYISGNYRPPPKPVDVQGEAVRELKELGRRHGLGSFKNRGLEKDARAVLGTRNGDSSWEARSLC